MDWMSLLTPTLKLFVIMDAIGLLPVFLLLSEKMPRKERSKAADKTMVVAAALLMVFVFGGKSILNFLGIQLPSFQIAGGIILLIMGLKTVLGLRLETQKRHAELYEFTAVPMATPLIVGPGTITTVLILDQTFGFWPVFWGSVINLILFWIILKNSTALSRVLGHQGSEIVSRLMGIVLTAWAIDFIRMGVTAVA